jgi:hypothetical protein
LRVAGERVANSAAELGCVRVGKVTVYREDGVAADGALHDLQSAVGPSGRAPRDSRFGIPVQEKPPSDIGLPSVERRGRNWGPWDSLTYHGRPLGTAVA